MSDLCIVFLGQEYEEAMTTITQEGHCVITTPVLAKMLVDFVHEILGLDHRRKKWLSGYCVTHSPAILESPELRGALIDQQRHQLDSEFRFSTWRDRG